MGAPASVVAGFAPDPAWRTPPSGVTYAGCATSVAVDALDNVIMFNRGPVPVVVIDDQGNVAHAWGSEHFKLPHDVTADPDGSIWLVGGRDHTVQNWLSDGTFRGQIGEHGRDAGPMSGGPFSEPTNLVVDPESRDLFICDGYGNARVHRFELDGRWISSFGSPGTEPGEFAIPHGLCVLEPGVLAVADGENCRVQILSFTGDVLETWPAFRPTDIALGTGPLAGLVLVAEMNPPRLAWEFPGIGRCVSIRDRSGNRAGVLGDPATGDGTGDREFVGPHSIATDSTGGVFVAEASAHVLRYQGFDVPAGEEVPSLRRWAPFAGGHGRTDQARARAS